MNLFRRKPPEDVPYWAGEMKPDDFNRFMQAVEKSIRKHNFVPVLNREQGTWSPKNNPKQQYGLHNLVLMCAPNVPLQWPEIIDHFMQKTLFIKIEDLSDDFSEIQNRIKLRLLPLDTQVSFQMITYPVCDQFLTVIAIDNPDSIHLPKAEVLDKWPVSKSQIYDLALQNIWEQDKPNIRELRTEEGTDLVEFRSESFFTASHILMLERHLTRPASNGALVVVPTRDNAFYYLIESLAAVQEVTRMISIANNFYSQFPGPVTQSLLWWRDGKLTNLPWEPLGEKINFTPPPEFVNMLNGLAGS